ncbi:MAG: phage minor head protein [Candidatus Competibacteraceae bacterium]
MAEADYGSLPFEEALAFFRQKLNLPTQRWDDLLGAAHDRAFVVAGAMQADLLADLKGAVEKAIAEGTTLDTFRRDFERIVAERGWIGWTGEGTQAGRAWRARIIYDTNLFTSYSAGRYQQMQAIANRRPFWRYRHSDASVVPRPQHVAWDGMILRHDDPWWSQHYPPNGWGCKCTVETLSEREMKKSGLTTTPEDDIPYNATDPKTGLPQGIDRGWDYQPGANADRELADLIAQQKGGWPPELAKAFDDLTRENIQIGKGGWREALDDEAWRYRLEGFKAGAGWLEKGGQLLRDTEGNVTGRTKWQAKEQWWADYISANNTGRVSAGKVPSIIEKALNGKRLGSSEEHFIQWLYEYTNAQKLLIRQSDELIELLPQNNKILLDGLMRRFSEHIGNQDVVNETIAALTEEAYANNASSTIDDVNEHLIKELESFLDAI